jgi:HEAT repeat protein
MGETERARRLRTALEAVDASDRLQSALAAGTRPEPEDVPVLIARSAVEPDFFVRDMLTWALTRHDAARTVPPLVAELERPEPQARAQSLHTLSKLRAPEAWPAIATRLAADADDEVARVAWRTGALVAPPEERPRFARLLVTMLGRGEHDVQRSLSRALAELGDDARPALTAAAESTEPAVRVHALASLQLLEDPDAAFDGALEDARRHVARAAAPVVPAEAPAGEGDADHPAQRVDD